MRQGRGGALGALRARNREMIVERLSHGPTTRPDLARSTGLSKTTISTLVAELVDEGVVEERDPPPRDGSRGRGRPAVVLGLATGRGWVVGVDFDHDRLRVAYADQEAATFEEQLLTDLDLASAPAGAIDAAAEMVSAVLRRARGLGVPILGVVMGIPGPLDVTTGTVGSAVMLPGWQTTAPGEALAQRIGMPVVVENDANLAALGELQFGAGRGLDDLVSVKVGTGIGAGLVLGGRLYRGARGTAGEIGHVNVEDSGRMCRCGGRGCLETLVALPQLVAALQPAHPRPLAREDLIALVAQGDPGATRVLADAGRTIGRVLVDLCTNLDPDAVIVCGDLGDALGPLVDGVRESVDRYGQPGMSSVVDVRQGTLGSRAAILGALVLAHTLSGLPGEVPAGLAGHTDTHKFVHKSA